MQVGVRLLNPEVFFKKLRKPLDDCFLLFRAVAAAKAGDGREDLVNIRAGRFERAVTEGIGNKALRLRGLQLFLRDDLLQLLLFLLLHITLPVAVNVRCSVDGIDKAMDQVLLLRSWMLESMARSMVPRMLLSLQFDSWYFMTSIKM